MKIKYFQPIRKRDFAEILENLLTAWHLVFFKTLPGCRTFSHSVTPDSKCDSPVFCLLSSNSSIRAGNITPKLTLKPRFAALKTEAQIQTNHDVKLSRWWFDPQCGISVRKVVLLSWYCMFVTFCFPSEGFERTSRFSLRNIGHAHLRINMFVVTHR